MVLRAYGQIWVGVLPSPIPPFPLSPFPLPFTIPLQSGKFLGELSLHPGYIAHISWLCSCYLSNAIISTVVY